MTTIIVTHEDNEIEEFEFESEMRTITLGRRTSNDVCIPDLSVSGNHAKIILQDNQAILEDLDSTNGTYVNGQVIQRTAVHQGDEIILGKILVSFASDEIADNARAEESPSLRAVSTSDSDLAPAPDETIASSGIQEHQENSHDRDDEAAEEQAHPLEGIEHLVVPSAKSTVTPMHELDSPSNTSKGAVIEIKNGAKSGQILPIDKPVTTLGRPGIQIAAIMRKPDGYFLMHIESDGDIDKPTLNSDFIGDEPVMLHSGDALTVAGIEVEFMLS